MEDTNGIPKSNSLADDQAASLLGSETTYVAWHPAFVEALQMELEAYREALEFHPEFQLTSEPLRIDCVVVKKVKGVAIEKNIAAIFRDVNLVEYKSPGDYVSISDFYKVYAYACLYAAFERVSIDSLTITFIESNYPRNLLAYLQQVRNCQIAETSPGVYSVTGDIIPIQAINSRRLSPSENLWLRDLSNDLKPWELRRLLAAIDSQDKAAKIRTYLDAITRANRDKIQEVLKMDNIDLSLEETMRELGLLEKWEARAEARGVAIGEARGEARGEAIGEARGEVRGEAKGEVKGVLTVARNMVTLGYSVESIIAATGLEAEKVKELYQ